MCLSVFYYCEPQTIYSPICRVCVHLNVWKENCIFSSNYSQKFKSKIIKEYFKKRVTRKTKIVWKINTFEPFKFTIYLFFFFVGVKCAVKRTNNEIEDETVFFFLWMWANWQHKKKKNIDWNTKSHHFQVDSDNVKPRKTKKKCFAKNRQNTLNIEQINKKKLKIKFFVYLKQ